MQEQEQVDAYVFVHAFEGRPSERLGELFGNDSVRFSGRFVGSFGGFAAVVAPDLETLQSWIDGQYWDAGLRSDWSVVVKPSSLSIPKRRSPDFCALIRVRVADGVDPEELLDRLDEHYHDNWEAMGYGAAVVTGGSFDLLVELGADSLPELWGRVRELRLQDGVARTATAVAFLPNNGLRR
jgi:hypothetical protein